MAEDTIRRKGRPARSSSVTAHSEMRSVSPPLVANVSPHPAPARDMVTQWWDYAVDVAQRWTLFVDILRQRANNMLVHEEAGLPPLLVTFEPRRVEDIQFTYPRADFERVRALSELNETLYEQLVSPYVRAAASPWGAEWLKWAHPMRWTCYAWSERFQPWLSPIAAMADEVRSGRVAAPLDNVWRSLEKPLSGMVTGALQATFSVRDATAEAAFLWLYGQPWLSAPANQDNPAQCNGACCP